MSGADGRLAAAKRRGMPAVAAACLLLASLSAAAAQRGAARTCSDELGRKAAASLVDQCRQVSLATRPPCNAENRCRLIRDEIHRSCSLLGSDAPTFCSAYVEVEEDADDDEEN